MSSVFVVMVNPNTFSELIPRQQRNPIVDVNNGIDEKTVISESSLGA